MLNISRSMLTRCYSFLVLALLVGAQASEEDTWKDSEHILKRRAVRDYKLRDIDENIEAIRNSHRRASQARRTRTANFQMKSLHEQQKQYPVSEKDWRRLEERRAFEEFVANLSDEEKRRLREERALRRKEQRAQRRSWL